MNKIGLTILVVVYFILYLSPIIVAHRRRHPHRWIITAVTAVGFCLGPGFIPILIWACWPIPLRVEINGVWHVLKRPDSLFLVFERDHSAFVAVVSAYCAPGGASIGHKKILLSLVEQNQLGWTNARYREMQSYAKSLRNYNLSQSCVSEILWIAGQRDLETILQARPQA